MHIFKSLAVAMSAAVLLAGCTSGESVSVEPLHVEGTALYAGDQPVVMNGVSIGWHNLWPRFYNAGAVSTMVNDWGVRIIRAAIGSDDYALEWNPGCDHGYMDDKQLALDSFFAVADAAIAEGAYVIADWHSHLTHLEEAREFFTAVATRYADSPNIIYELFNEPVCFSFEENRSYADLGNPEAMEEFWRSLKAYSEDLIETITSLSNVHPLILVGCPSWDQRIDLPAADPITTYDNVMYTVHFYAATHKQELRDACDAALAAGAPIFLSECASCESSGDGPIDEQSWEEWSSWAADKGITMLMWSLSDKDETCSMLLPAATSEGPWPDEVIKPWGTIVRGMIK